jgi:hypothetical protein
MEVVMGKNGNQVNKFRRRIFKTALTIIALSVVWGITAKWAVSDVVSFADRSLRSMNPEFNRIDFDPDIKPSLREKKEPWYFIGNASTPFPFIVAVDYALRIGPLAGQRSRAYVFWFFGLKIPIHETLVWMS